MWSESVEGLNPYEAMIDKNGQAYIFRPPPANTELVFGTDNYYNFSIHYYRNKPLNRFQIWMYKLCFGITAKNTERR